MSRYEDGSYAGGGGQQPLRVPDRYVPRHNYSNNSRGRVMNYMSERVRPLGLISKYPNYEPFNPPPREDFQYPAAMQPPQPKQRRRRTRSPTDSPSSRSRSRSYSMERRRSRYRSRSADRHRHHSREERRHYHHRSHHRSPSETRRRHDSRSRSRSYSKSRSHSHSHRESRSKSRSAAPAGEDDCEMIKKYWEKADSGAESEVDLEKDLNPLTYHVHSRKRLLKEAVRSLKGKRLKAMIPPLLKDTNADTLQDECLRILEDIDSESIISILDGKMAGIFDKAQELEPKEDLNSSGAKSAAKKEKKKKKIASKESSKKKKAKEEEESKSKKKKKAKAAKKKKKEAEANTAAAPTKSLMELLELEYRAKAIKALLKQQGVTGIDIDDAVGTLGVSTPPPPDLTRAGHQKEAASKPKIVKKTVKIVRRVVKKKIIKPIEKEALVITVPEIPPLELDAVSSAANSSEGETHLNEQNTQLLDKVDDALSTEFDHIAEKEETSLEKPKIVFALENNLEEDQLRLKLLKNYQNRNQSDETEEIKPNKPLKTKTKSVIIPVVKEVEDVLDLHADDKLIYEGDEDEVSQDEVIGADSVDEEKEVVQEDDSGEGEGEVEDIKIIGLENEELEDVTDENTEEEFEEIIEEEEVEVEEEEEEVVVEETGDDLEDPVPEDIEVDVPNEEETAMGDDEVEEELVQEPEEPEEPEEGEYVSGESEKERIPTPLPPPRKTPSPKKKKRKSKSRRSSHSSISKSPSPPKSRRWQSVPEKSPETSPLKTLPIKRGNSPVEFIKSFDKLPQEQKELSSSGDEDVARSSSLIRPVIVPMKIVMPTSLPVQGPETKSQDYLEEVNSDSQTNLFNISEAENDKEKSAEESSDEDKSKPKTSRETRDSSPPPVTWYERWFQSKSMQKVVKTNKIQKKLRKKLKKNVKEAAKPPPDLSKDAGLPVIGSIEEYEKLFGKKVQTPQGPVSAPVEIQEEKEAEEEEENEEEADLWGDIIGDD